MRASLPAKPAQMKKFKERRTSQKKTVLVNGKQFIALPNVYDTSTDTELMVDVVSISPDETFIEIGCGTGAVTLLVSQHAKSGVGVDINPESIKNADLNKEGYGVDNVTFYKSNVFDNVKGEFDVLICNPPYNSYKPADEVEMMFWDEDDAMKKKFFRQVPKHVRSGGKVYFGWADFGDLDEELPLKLAKSAGLAFVKRYERLREEGGRTFYVYEFENPVK